MNQPENTKVTLHLEEFMGAAGLDGKIADAFAKVESNNLLVRTLVLHPSLVHRFVYTLRDSLDVDLTFKTVGRLWGATVVLDQEAPKNGFILKSENDNLCLRLEGPNPPTHDQTVFCKDPVHGMAIMELLDMSGKWGDQSLRLECSPKLYSAIRKFGRDIIDIETRASTLKTGIQSYVFGVTVKVSRDAHPTQFVLRDDDRVYAVLETDQAANPSLKTQTDKVLGGEPPEEYINLLLEGAEKGLVEAWPKVAYNLEDSRLEKAKRILMRAVIARLSAKYV